MASFVSEHEQDRNYIFPFDTVDDFRFVSVQKRPLSRPTSSFVCVQNATLSQTSCKKSIHFWVSICEFCFGKSTAYLLVREVRYDRVAPYCVITTGSLYVQTLISFCIKLRPYKNKSHQKRRRQCRVIKTAGTHADTTGKRW